MTGRPVVAFAVTGHGYGHAARTCAVIEALRARADLCPVIFSAVPATFFLDNLGPDTRVEAVEVDVGLVQRDALTVDLAASIARLQAFYGRFASRSRALAGRLRELGVRALVADIAPLGLAAAQRLGLPSVLLESFTWDFIYRALAEPAPAFTALADTVADASAGATLHLRCTPSCDPASGGLEIGVIARAARRGRAATRRALGIPADQPAALVTMGGIPWHHAVDEAARADPDAWLVFASDVPKVARRGRTIALPHRSPFHHPDLVAAVDVVVAKLGYSTLAEVARADRTLIYVPRPGYPESPSLEAWAERHLDTVRVMPDDFAAGRWFPALTDALADRLRRRAAPAPVADGAAQAADAVLELLGADDQPGTSPAQRAKASARSPAPGRK